MIDLRSMSIQTLYFTMKSDSLDNSMLTGSQEDTNSMNDFDYDNDVANINVTMNLDDILGETYHTKIY